MGCGYITNSRIAIKVSMVRMVCKDMFWGIDVLRRFIFVMFGIDLEAVCFKFVLASLTKYFGKFIGKYNMKHFIIKK